MQDIITRLRAKKDDEGFTLIELLVVVVIIGVLVAIAVPVYLNYRQGAYDKSAQSDVRGAVSAIEQFYSSNGNVYPLGFTTNGTVTTASLVLVAAGPALGTITISENTKINYVPVGSPATSYKVCGNNTGGTGKWYYYDSTKGGSVSATALTTPGTCTI
jgi:type IV pilus assembly protein PilA